MIKLEPYKSDMTGLLRHEVGELKKLLSILMSLPRYLTSDLDSAAFLSKIKQTIQAYEYMLRHSEKFDRLHVREMEHDDEIDAASQLQTWTDEAKSAEFRSAKFRVTMNPKDDPTREIRPDLAVPKEAALETDGTEIVWETRGFKPITSNEVKSSTTGLFSNSGSTVTLSSGSGLTLSPGTTLTLSQGTSSTGTIGIDVTTESASPIYASTFETPIVSGANEWIWKELIADYIPETVQFKISAYPNAYSKATEIAKARIPQDEYLVTLYDEVFSVHLHKCKDRLSIYEFVEIYIAYRRDIYGNSPQPFTEDEPKTLSGKLLGNASGWMIALGHKLGDSVDWKDMTLMELLAAYQYKKKITDSDIVDMLDDDSSGVGPKCTVISIPVPPEHKPGEPIMWVPPAAAEARTMKDVLADIKWPMSFEGVPHGTADRMNLLSWHRETWVKLIKEFIGDRLGVITFHNTYKVASQFGTAHVMGDVFNISDPSFKLKLKDYIDLFEAYMTDMHDIGRNKAPMENPGFAENKILYYSEAIMSFICSKFKIQGDKRRGLKLEDLLRLYRDHKNIEEKR
jgi:hypothetical protein